VAGDPQGTNPDSSAATANPTAQADPPPAISGLAALTFEPVESPLHLAEPGAHRSFRLAPSYPLPPIPQVWCNIEAPEHLINDQNFYPPAPEILFHSIDSAVIFDRGLLAHQGAFVHIPASSPDWSRGLIASGYFGNNVHILDRSRWADRREIIVDGPVSCPLFATPIYGHVLLEAIPRLASLAVLRRLGVRFNLALPQNAPEFFTQLAELYFSRSEILWFDSQSEVIVPVTALLAPMCHTHYNFHPLLNEHLSELRLRLGLPSVPEALGPQQRSMRAIYLSRSKLPMPHRLTNAGEIDAEAEALGFEVVHPESLSFLEQVRLYDSTTLLMGEAASALHNAIFCRPGTPVISLNAFSNLQNAISRLRQQPHAYVAPDDGQFRHVSRANELGRTYRIDPVDMRSAVFAMCPELRERWEARQREQSPAPAVGLASQIVTNAEAVPDIPKVDGILSQAAPIKLPEGMDPQPAAPKPTLSPAWQALRSAPPPVPASKPARRGLFGRLLGGERDKASD
jgi:hypothetical protein